LAETSPLLPPRTESFESACASMLNAVEETCADPEADSVPAKAGDSVARSLTLKSHLARTSRFASAKLPVAPA